MKQTSSAINSSAPEHLQKAKFYHDQKVGLIVFVVVAGVGLGKVIKEPIAKLTGTNSALPEYTIPQCCF